MGRLHSYNSSADTIQFFADADCVAVGLFLDGCRGLKHYISTGPDTYKGAILKKYRNYTHVISPTR